MELELFLKSLKFGVIYFVLATRVFGLSLYSIWLLDCYFREAHMRVLCQNFSLFPMPEVFTSIWLITISLSSICLILYVRRLQQFPGLKTILKHILRQKYFYKISVALALVLTYDLIMMLSYEVNSKDIVSCSFLVEHITSVALMFILNFVPDDFIPWSMIGVTYKVTLVVYTLENYALFVLETVAAAKNIIAAPSNCLKQDLHHNNIHSNSAASLLYNGGTKIGKTNNCDYKSSTMVVIHLILIYIRHITGEFFLTKMFRQNSDILHTPLNPIDSLSTRDE